MPYVWDYKLKTAKKSDPRFRKWRLERLINYGLKPGEKISKRELKKYFDDLKIDRERRELLKMMLRRAKRAKRA